VERIMLVYRTVAVVLLMTIPAFVPCVQAQQPTPRIGYVYPAGGRQGASFRVTVGGQFLDGAANAYVFGGGVLATVVECIKPMNPQQAQLLRDKLKELQERKAAAAKGDAQPGTDGAAKPSWTPEDDKLIADIRKKLAAFLPRTQITPAIAETVVLDVKIAPDAAPGDRDLRLRTSLGLTNPLVFCVGRLPETSREPARSYKDPYAGGGAALRQPRPEMEIALPGTVNGQIMPGSADRYRFRAQKGQSLVVSVRARELIPYISDAVPGWFQATVTLFDSKGRELAFTDDYRFHPDPVLNYQVPEDGDYAIETRDSIFRGREDFVYRMTIGSQPFITSIFPLGGKAGTQTTIDLAGWNLAANKLTQESANGRQGIHTICIHDGDAGSNSLPFAVDALPECMDKEPNNLPTEAQRLSLPAIVNGRIDQPGDWDVFRFDARAGEDIVAEVTARRLESPLDSVLKLTDANGKQLAFNDDHEDRGSGLNTHHADSWLRVTVPSDGAYFLYLGDVQHKGGMEYAYRLRIGPPRPDFELRVVPSSINLRGGTSVPLTIYALRKDGFSGEITLALRDMPAGFTLSGARVPDNQDQVKVTLKAPATQFEEPIDLHIEGRATIQGQAVSRQAVPAEDMMQAFSYRHLVPVKEALVAVSPQWMARRDIRILSATPVMIQPGRTARIHVGLPTTAPLGKIRLELADPPEGVSLQGVAPLGMGTEIALQSDAVITKPGLKGNLIFSVFVEREAAAGNAGGVAGNRRRIPVGSLPAIPYEVAAP
jgi:hypothetical protein